MPNPAPRVTVIMAVLNGEAYLAEAIGSVLGQTCPPSQILVIDNGSTDRTAEIAQSYRGIQYVRQETKGLANARNLGIRLAEEEFVAFLDHDDIWAPRKLELQIDRMCGNPALGYTITRMLFLYGEDAPRARERERGMSGQPQSAPTPSALVARRGLFEQIGGFDPQYRIGCDSDWFLRARDAEIPTEELPEALLYKRLHASNLSLDATTNRLEMARIARQSILRRAGKRG